ncbi:MAG: hypothetical protein NTU62_08125 [Spirochaetes bacterium]|nr:hypothetical protein [Spirochaetota bacterium]
MAEDLSRREFLRTAGRAIALGGLGVLVFRLLRRGGVRRPSGTETCVNDGLCRGCGAFAGCGLPAALSAKARAPWARGRS